MILITGGSGQLSSLIAARMERLGLDYVVGSHAAQGSEGRRRRIDFDDPASLDFRGIDTLCMVSAGYGEDDVVIRRHDQVVSAAERCCVRQVVYTSLIGGGDHLGFALAHRWTERRLRASNLSWTILRNGLYAELIAALAKPDNGVIRAPFGDGAVAAVAREDLADAAVAVLSSPASHVGRVYELPGRTAWSMSQFARQIGAEYRPASLKEARRGLSSPPLLPFQPAMLMSIYSAVAGGFLADTAGDLEQLLTGVPRDGLAVACRAAGSARP